MRIKVTLSVFFLLFSQSAIASEYTLQGFKSKVSKKAPAKVKVYVQDKKTGTCILQGAIKTQALTKLIQKKSPVFVGVYKDCNVAGFRFDGPRTFWFHTGNLIIDDEIEWETYLKNLGPDIHCSGGTNSVKLAGSSRKNTASALGFCGG